MHQQAQPMIVMGPNGIPFVVPSPMGLQQQNMQNMHMGMMAPMMTGSLPAYGMNHMHVPGMGMGPMQPMPIQSSLAPAVSGLQPVQLSQHAAPFNPPVAAVGAGAAPAFGVSNPAAVYVTSELVRTMLRFSLAHVLILWVFYLPVFVTQTRRVRICGVCAPKAQKAGPRNH